MNALDLRLVRAHRLSGARGRPERWFVQSWYPFPKQMVPETAPHSMTALVKAVIERVRHDAPERASSPGEVLTPGLTPHSRPLVEPVARSPGARVTPARSNRIQLTAVPGKMVAVARVPALGGQTFSLGIPETIGSRERMILNFPEVDGRLAWTDPAQDGAIESEWTTPGTIH